LPIEARVVLAQKLWESIEGFVDPDIEEAWLKEAEKRWQDIETGRVTCIPADKAMEKAKTRLNRNE
jgi:putative addiction module component (TIGR02574 family)